MALQTAIKEVTSVTPDLRWPNDLLLGKKKFCGILAEMNGQNASRAIVLGIGINVNHAGFPPELAAEATSLRIATGRPHSREDLLIDLLPAIDRFCRTQEVFDSSGARHRGVLTADDMARWAPRVGSRCLATGHTP